MEEEDTLKTSKIFLNYKTGKIYQFKEELAKVNWRLEAKGAEEALDNFHIKFHEFIQFIQ